MKKYLGKTAVFLAFFLLLIPLFTTPVAARRTSVIVSLASGNPWPFLLMIVIVIVLVIIKKVRKGSDSNISFPGGTDYSGLSTKEMETLASFKAEVKASKPDPVSTTCPNCGAPLTISDTVMCPYCRTQLTNNSIDPKYRKKKTIPPEQYNPRRYYEENNTGYDSIKDQPNDGSYYGEQPTGFSPYGTGTSSPSNSGIGSSPFASDAYNGGSSYGSSSYGSDPSSFGSSSYGSDPSSFGSGSYGSDPSSFGSGSYGSDPSSFGSSGTGNDSFGSGFASGSGFNDHL